MAVSDQANAPGIAADLAVLDKGAFDVWLEIDLDVFTAVRAAHKKAIVHSTFATTYVRLMTTMLMSSDGSAKVCRSSLMASKISLAP